MLRVGREGGGYNFPLTEVCGGHELSLTIVLATPLIEEEREPLKRRCWSILQADWVENSPFLNPQSSTVLVQLPIISTI